MLDGINGDVGYVTCVEAAFAELDHRHVRLNHLRKARRASEGRRNHNHRRVREAMLFPAPGPSFPIEFRDTDLPSLARHHDTALFLRE